MRLFLELLLLCLFFILGPALVLWIPEPFGVICFVFFGVVLVCVAFG